MPEETTTPVIVPAPPPPSPTGTPLVPPQWVPLLIAVGGAIVTGLEMAQEEVVSPIGKVALRVLSLLVVGALGAISPGWRK